jgi:tetratricopeptide (TPR) repeat protein
LVVSGDFPEGQGHLDRAEALYDPEADSRPLLTKFGMGFPLFLTFRSYARWALGRPEAARADIERALGDARRIGPGVTLMGVLHLTATTRLRLGEIAAAKAQADELVALAGEKSAPARLAHGMADQSCVLAWSGETAKAVQSFEQAIAYDRSLASTVEIPSLLSVLAKVHADLGQFDEARRCVGEAIALGEASGERWWEAEFHRTAGEIELMAPERNAAQAKPYSNARSKSPAPSRPPRSIARLWRDQGHDSEARHLLARVYGWFTEGFDTPDLRAAKALLEERA